MCLEPFAHAFFTSIHSLTRHSHRYGEERYERRDLQQRVRQKFHELRDTDTQLSWYTVSAAQTMDHVEAEIYEAVQATLQNVRAGKKLGKMWQDGCYYDL